MKAGKIKKAYTAILEKRPGVEYKNCLRIQDYIGFRKKAFVTTEPSDDSLKPTHSLFVKKEETEKTVKYTVILLTGKRHQIRIHSSTYLSPICGDDLYGSKIKYDDYHTDLYCTALNFTYNNTRYRLRKTY